MTAGLTDSRLKADGGTGGEKTSPLGVHVSIAGGLDKAIERTVLLGCDAMQSFGGNPRGWSQRPLDDSLPDAFKSAREAAGIRSVVIHASYLINLASPDPELSSKSVALLEVELERAHAIGADFVVVHLGSARGHGPDYGVERVTSSIGRLAALLNRPGYPELLLENTAGSGDTVGSNFGDIARVIKAAEAGGVRLGLCMDTCHAFAAGYSFASREGADALVGEIEGSVGIERMKVIHLNDSKGGCGSKLDRHEHIGKGMIGSFGPLLNHEALRGIPLILETPKKTPLDDPENLKKVRGILRKGLHRVE